MTSQWSKVVKVKNKLKSMIKSTESEILQQYNETNKQNSVTRKP